MADTEALKIIKAVVARLEVASVDYEGVAQTPPAGLTVEMERVTVIQPKAVKNGPLVVVYQEGQKPTEREHHKSKMLKRVLKLKFIIGANANDVTNSEALDPPYSWVIKALQSDPTLGVGAHWIDEMDYEDAATMFEESSDIVALREMGIEVHFHSRTENPEVRS